nr:uncharacterized protein LOC112790060 [Arachis hypogaea]
MKIVNNANNGYNSGPTSATPSFTDHTGRRYSVFHNKHQHRHFFSTQSSYWRRPLLQQQHTLLFLYQTLSSATPSPSLASHVTVEHLLPRLLSPCRLPNSCPLAPPPSTVATDPVATAAPSKPHVNRRLNTAVTANCGKQRQHVTKEKSKKEKEE